MAGLFQSLKDKAQSVVNSSGLSDRIPGGAGRTDDRTSPNSPSGGQQGGLAGLTKTHAFESISHQLRSFQQQYSSSTTPVQKIITSGKGVALDYDAVARDVQAQSKEMYLWGQADAEDIKDVTDRLGWLNFVHGSLASHLASKLDGARAPFKALRDAENALAPRRNIRTGLQTQISRMEYDQYDQRGNKEKQQRLAELKAQLARAEAEDVAPEKDIELLKRKAVRESEQLKWAAVREYAEKLSMVAQAALNVVPALPPLPPTPAQPYRGAESTAAVRASLQNALDHYAPGDVTLIVGQPAAGDLKHTRSFGVTHAQELARIGAADANNNNIPMTPALSGATAPPPAQPSPSYSPQFPQPATSPLSQPVPITTQSGSPPLATMPAPLSVSPPLNPHLLNQAPAPLPPPLTMPVASAGAPNASEPAVTIPSATPTIAETGVPKSAGPDGPGPATGSLLDKKPSAGSGPFAGMPAPTAPAPAPAPVPTQYESAEDEKKRLEREEREKLLHGESGSAAATAPTPKYESAQEEKERLAREEQARLSSQGSSDHPPTGPGHEDHPTHDDGELPPYQEF